jgi:hypothetical protein
MEMGTVLRALLVLWAVITAALICVWIYRSTLETHEEDQIFLDAAGESTATEQRTLVTRIERLGKPITALAILSGILLVAMAALWLWQGFRSF